ncbi:MAG: DNA topoisomerase [Clostridia bacterium]|nr:DNA topoisomerase [Clostridia bacterium]
MAVKREENISSLKGADRVRKRPGVIFGSDGIEGCQHSVFEILSNSIDEAREGRGDRIILTRYADGSVSVEDYAGGIPVEYNKKEERYNWELLFCELYAGGKYENAEGAFYGYSLGLNGLGLCATQYASRWMDATIHRDGYEYTLHFENGENVGGLHKKKKAYTHTGSLIRWMPDDRVFTDVNLQRDALTAMCNKQAVTNGGLTITLVWEDENGSESTDFLYPNGIVDYLSELVGSTGLCGQQFWQTERTGRDSDDRPEYKLKVNAALTFSNQSPVIEYYHNSSPLEHGGAPEKAVKSAFVSMFDGYFKQRNKYTKGEEKLTFADIEDCLCLVISSFSTQVSYENQTKKAITNKFIQEAMTDFFKHYLEVWFLENPAEAEKVADQILVNKHSRENAEKTRVSMKKKLAGNLDIANRVQKFVDCRSRDTDVRELYIVEGDSALGACKQARDSEFQAIIPVRGKILNCLKSDYDKIFKNEIITDIIKVLGCGVQIKTKAAKSAKSVDNFDISRLRWNKVIICTDADVDGFHIRTQILAMIYRLMPALIEQGYVFIAESPLYEINSKGKTYFAYTEHDKAEILKMIEGQKYTVQRSKGLGENEPEMMWETTMNPASRRLIKVYPDTVEATAQMFEVLLGDNLSGRKDMIALKGADYIDLADIS